MSRILHLIGRFNSDEGGAQKVIVDIISSCRDKTDLEMGVCSLFGQATLSKELPKDVFKANLNKNFKYNPKIFFDLYNIIAEWKPDILHVHTSIVGIFGRPIAKMCGIKIISTVHNDVRKISFRNKILDKSTIGLSDTIVCVSDLAKTSVLEEYGSYLAGNEICTVWNSLDCAEFKKKINVGVADKCKELGLKRNSLIVGSVGRLHPKKGHEFLVKAWPGVVCEFPDAVLLLIGDGKEISKLKRLATELEVSDSICFLGSRNDIAELLNILDVFVFPSHSEGFGIALLEAMCMEKVIISSDIAPLKQILGDSGIFVQPGDSELLGEQIKIVLDGLEEKKKLGKKAGLRVLNNFNPEEFGANYFSIYKNALQKE